MLKINTENFKIYFELQVYLWKTPEKYYTWPFPPKWIFVKRRAKRLKKFFIHISFYSIFYKYVIHILPPSLQSPANCSQHLHSTSFSKFYCDRNLVLRFGLRGFSVQYSQFASRIWFTHKHFHILHIILSSIYFWVPLYK